MNATDVLEFYYGFVKISDYSTCTVQELENKRKFLSLLLYRLVVDNVPQDVRKIVSEEISCLDKIQLFQYKNEGLAV